jgi:hypothetical protein
MKQLTILLFFVAALTSCGTMKKSFYKKTDRTDSVTNKTETKVDVKKKDSTGSEVTQTNQVKTSDSGYTKTTVIKEYWGDEFDFAGTDTTEAGKDFPEPDKPQVDPKDYEPTANAGNKPGKDPGKKQIGNSKKLLYRETTIKETGTVKKTEDLTGVTEKKGTVNQSDSAAAGQSEITRVTKEKTDVKSSKRRTTTIVGLSFLLLLLIVAYVLYRRYKNKKDEVPIIRTL